MHALVLIENLWPANELLLRFLEVNGLLYRLQGVEQQAFV